MVSGLATTALGFGQKGKEIAVGEGRFDVLRSASGGVKPSQRGGSFVTNRAKITAATAAVIKFGKMYQNFSF
jgi:hypothetical protein